MYQEIYRFKDSNGKTRNKAVVTYDNGMLIRIDGTATEYQMSCAIEGGDDTVGALTVQIEGV